jgi:hypothetical protein
MTIRKNHKFYQLGPGFEAQKDVHVLGSSGVTVGITDQRFASRDSGPALGKKWPDLMYDKNAVGLVTGERLTPELAARLNTDLKVRLTDEAKAASRDLPARMPDIVSSKLVSRRVMDIIESLEPGRHQFFPITLRSEETGARLYEDQGFHYINILNWVAPDLLYDLEATPGSFEVERRATTPHVDDVADFQIRPAVSITTIHARTFRPCPIRAEWIGIGRIFITGPYSKSRLNIVQAERIVIIDDALHERLREVLPEEGFESTEIAISNW